LKPIVTYRSAAQFAIDHGIDMTIRDYRWSATAEGWARHAAQDTKMAEFLARAETRKESGVVEKRAREPNDFPISGFPDVPIL
jgi:hypothetical protein